MTNAKATAKSRRPREEAIRIGKEIHVNVILPQVGQDHIGEIAAIDVDTGQWVIAATTRAATDSLRAQCPDAVNIVCERVGYKALDSLGGGLRRLGE